MGFSVVMVDSGGTGPSAERRIDIDRLEQPIRERANHAGSAVQDGPRSINFL
jgi:hypothetical protein